MLADNLIDPVQLHFIFLLFLIIGRLFIFIINFQKFNCINYNLFFINLEQTHPLRIFHQRCLLVINHYLRCFIYLINFAKTLTFIVNFEYILRCATL